MGAMRSLLNGIHELRHLIRKSGGDVRQVKITVTFDSPEQLGRVMSELHADPLIREGEYGRTGIPTNAVTRIAGVNVEFTHKERGRYGRYPWQPTMIGDRPYITTSQYLRQSQSAAEFAATMARLFGSEDGDIPKPRTPNDEWPPFEVIEKMDGG